MKLKLTHKEHKLLTHKSKLSIIVINICHRSIFSGTTKFGDYLSHYPGHGIHQFLASGFEDLVPSLRDLLVQFTLISALGVLQLSFDYCPEVLNG